MYIEDTQKKKMIRLPVLGQSTPSTFCPLMDICVCVCACVRVCVRAKVDILGLTQNHFLRDGPVFLGMCSCGLVFGTRSTVWDMWVHAEKATPAPVGNGNGDDLGTLPSFGLLCDWLLYRFKQVHGLAYWKEKGRRGEGLLYTWALTALAAPKGRENICDFYDDCYPALPSLPR